MVVVIISSVIIMIGVIALAKILPQYDYVYVFGPLVAAIVVVCGFFLIQNMEFNQKIDNVGKNIIGVDKNNIYYTNEDDILSWEDFDIVYTQLDEPGIIIDKTKSIYNITVKWPLNSYQYYEMPKITVLSDNYLKMDKYEGYDTNINSRFIDSSVKKVKAKINNNESFIAYFGFSECPHCNKIINIVAENANIYNQDIFYIDTRKNASWKSNLDIDNYDMLVDLLGDYLEYDENSIKHLYVPTIIFIKNGEIKSVVAINKDDKTVSNEFIEKLNTEFSLFGGE